MKEEDFQKTLRTEQITVENDPNRNEKIIPKKKPLVMAQETINIFIKYQNFYQDCR